MLKTYSLYEIEIEPGYPVFFFAKSDNYFMRKWREDLENWKPGGIWISN